ncbi:hypothetical protein GLOTRDRAFT_26784, partial [Gloeophyllum trabeum ATCC 11539]
DIPPEIWLLIFQYATYIPESHNIIPADPFQRSRFPRMAMGANTPVLSMRTKWSLVLVCRAWRQLATVLLYEHLVIRSLRRALKICSTLRNSVRRATINGIEVDVSEYGQWTKHIEVHAHIRTFDTMTFAEVLYRILQCCPNVRILSGTWDRPIPRWLMAALPRFYGSKLELLQWDSLSLTTRSTDVCTLTPEFLTAFHSLRTLDLRKFGGWNETDYGKPNLALPRLSHLLLTTNESSLRTATSLVLPSLTHVVVEVPYFYPVPLHLEHLDAFLEAHGPKITYLEVVSSPMYISADDANPDAPHTVVLPSHRLNIACFLMPGVCTHLQDLVFDVHEHVIDFKGIPTPHQSLRRVGLRGLSGEAISPERPHPSQAIYHLKSFRRKYLPSLEIVRTLGFYGDAMEKPTLGIFIQWTEFFEKRGIDLQDGEGVVWLWADDEEDDA